MGVLAGLVPNESQSQPETVLVLPIWHLTVLTVLGLGWDQGNMQLFLGLGFQREKARARLRARCEYQFYVSLPGKYGW